MSQRLQRSYIISLLLCFTIMTAMGGAIEEGTGTGDRKRLMKETELVKIMEVVHTGGSKGRKTLQAAAAKIGSRPPSCKAKCKGCTPCSPVQVTVPPAQHNNQHGAHLTHVRPPTTIHVDESPYYSVAWRCRCKGKDYNP